MKEIILWLFTQIASFIETSLTWKIYGDFSLTHFLLASLFLTSLFGLFGFTTHNFGNGIRMGILSYRNSENKKERENYYHETVSRRNQDGSITRSNYKINKKTGEVHKL